MSEEFEVRTAGGDVLISSDSINHPSHYRLPNGVECIDVTQWFNFARGNAIKYIWRAGKKNPATEIEDLKKARKNLDFEITRLEKLAWEESRSNAPVPNLP